MQSLMYACIFCTSNPRGQTTFFALYVLEGNTFSPGSIFLIIFSNFSNPLSVVPFSAFHCSNSSVVPSFFWPSSQFGYNGLLWSSNIFSNFNLSFFTSAVYLRIKNGPTQIVIGVIKNRLIKNGLFFSFIFPHSTITVFSEHRIVVTILFFFVVFQYNPSLSVLGPTIIAGHETILQQVDVNGL